MVIPAQAAALTLTMQWFMQTPSDHIIFRDPEHAACSCKPTPPRPPVLTQRRGGHGPAPRPRPRARTHSTNSHAQRGPFITSSCSCWLITEFYWSCLSLIQSLITYLFKLIQILLSFPDFFWSLDAGQVRFFFLGFVFCFWLVWSFVPYGVSLLKREKECVRVVSLLQTGRPWDGSHTKTMKEQTGLCAEQIM